MVSSRTYVSTLERGMKSPTLDKLEELAAAMDVHPLTVLTLTYLYGSGMESPEELLELVKGQVATILERGEP